MFSKTPELYDQIYGSFKDYAAECARIAAVLRERAPDAQRILVRMSHSGVSGGRVTY